MSDPDFSQFAAQIRDFEHLMTPAGRVPWITRFIRPAHPVDVVLYLGCNILRTAHIGCDAVALFEALGIHFTAVAGPQFCCGIVPHRAGDIEGANGFAQATAAKFEAYGAKQIVIWCPTCKLRFEELIRKDVIPKISMVQASEFLAAKTAQFDFPRLPPVRLAVHTHVGSSQREAEAKSAIKLLKAIPGVEVVGVYSSPDLGYQCAPLLLPQLSPERFRSILDNLIQEARRMRCDKLVTLYHSCHRELCGVGEEALPIQNYVSVMAEALGCAHRDYFQEFKKLNAPDSIAAISRPMWESHGLTEEQALTLARKYFAPKKI